MLHWKTAHPRVFEHHRLDFMGLNETTGSWLAREAGVFLGRVGRGKVITNKTIKGMIKCLKIKEHLPLSSDAQGEKYREEMDVKTMSTTLL